MHDEMNTLAQVAGKATASKEPNYSRLFNSIQQNEAAVRRLEDFIQTLRGNSTESGERPKLICPPFQVFMECAPLEVSAQAALIHKLIDELNEVIHG